MFQKHRLKPAVHLPEQFTRHHKQRPELAGGSADGRPKPTWDLRSLQVQVRGWGRAPTGARGPCSEPSHSRGHSCPSCSCPSSLQALGRAQVAPESQAGPQSVPDRGWQEGPSQKPSQETSVVASQDSLVAWQQLCGGWSWADGPGTPRPGPHGPHDLAALDTCPPSRSGVALMTADRHLQMQKCWATGSPFTWEADAHI